MVPSPADRHVPGALIYGLILEDLKGFDLAEYEPSMGNYAALGHSLMAAVSTFPAHGVLHCDIRAQNILITSSKRIVLIDFGHATLRKAADSDEDWNGDFEYEEEMSSLQHVLNHRRLRARTPFDLRLHQVRSCHWANNHNVSLYPKEAVERWFDEVPQGGEKVANRERWRLKPEVAVWLDTRGPPPQCYFIPRPGSPESHTPTSHLDVFMRKSSDFPHIL